MKKLLRVLSVITTIVLMVISKPTYVRATTMTAEAYWPTAQNQGDVDWNYIKNRINTIDDNYLIPYNPNDPDSKMRYWNHYGLTQSWQYNYYTITEHPCDYHEVGVHGPYDNVYDGDGGDASQCMGFAKLYCKGIFGTDIWDNDWEYIYSVDDLRIGDYVRQGYHSYVITHIEGDAVDIIQCNADCRCGISFGSRSLSELRNITWETHEYYGTDPNTSRWYIRHCRRNKATQNPPTTQNIPISRTITFKVVNGSWNDGTTADKIVKLSGYEGDSLSLKSSQIPAVGNKPGSAYKAGSWNVTPTAGSAITSNIIYTYTYKEASAMDAETYWNTANTTDKLYWDDVKQRINDIMSYYLIPGQYWNHTGGVSGGGNVTWDNAYTTTNTPCGSHSITMYGWDHEGEYCNWYDGASQCMGFAKLFSKGIFGTGIWSGDWSFGTVDNLCIGDYVRQNGHSYVVTHIAGDEVTIIQCNASGNCKISVGYRYLSQLRNVGFETIDHDYEFNYIRHCNRNMSNSATSMVVERSEVAELAYSQIGTEGGSKYYNSGDSGAWAVDFAKWCVRQCGMPASWWPELRSTTKLVKWFQGENRWHDKVNYNWSYQDVSGGGTISKYVPRSGDVAAIETSNDADGPETIGIVYRVNITDDIVDIIVGNVDNKVALRSFNLSDLYLCDGSNKSIHVIGFAEPEYGRTVREPVGAVEVIEGGEGTIRIKGWAFDYDEPLSPIQIAVYVGSGENSGAESHIIMANSSRSDVNQAYGGGIGNNHGFDEIITVNARGSQDIYIYAIDIGSTILTNTSIGSLTAQRVQIKEPAANILQGSVNVTGILKYGKILTADVTSNNSGKLSYQWKRDSMVIGGATKATYKLAKADIGKYISCEVTSSVETGNIIGTTSSTISKADGPAAPVGITGIAPSVLGAEDGKLQGVSTAMEYADNESFTNSISCTGAEVTGLKAGTYYVRVAETATAKAGAAAVVTVPEGEEAAVLAAADIDGVATNLEGKVGLIFYVVMSDYVLADSGAYATLSINGTEEKQLVANAPHSPKGELDRHAFSYYATSTQLREKITLNLYLSDGTRVPMTRKGEAVPETGFEYSVSEYCDLAIAGSTNPAMVKLAKQVKAYGTAAQIYFNRNAEGLVVDDAVKAVTADDLQAYAEVTSGELPEGLVAAKPQGAVLILDEVTTLRVNWKFEQGVDPESFSYQIDGVEAMLKHVGNDYFLEVANISSKQLGNAHEFTISRDGKSYTWKGSALTWALAAVQKGGDNAKNVGKALYLYCQAAKDYFR